MENGGSDAKLRENQKFQGKLRWGLHPESTCLVQLQFKNCGMWFTLEGTTTHILNDAGKFVEEEKYARSLGLI